MRLVQIQQLLNEDKINEQSEESRYISRLVIYIVVTLVVTTRFRLGAGVGQRRPVVT